MTWWRWQRTMGVMMLAGCTPLTPYEQVASELGADALVPVRGQRVHVQTWGPQAGGSRPLILLHGFASSTYAFETFAPRVATGRRVVAIDLNGFGLTERPTAAEAYSPAGQARLVLAVMDQLGISQADFLGHSYGGALAMKLAAEQPSRVGRLILVSPALDLAGDPPAWLRWPPVRWAIYPVLRLLLSQPQRFERLLARAYHRPGRFTPEVAEAYRCRLLVEGLWHSYRGFGASMTAQPEESPQLGQLPARTMLVAGRQDAIIPPARFEAAAADSGVMLRLIDECGHSVPEEQPERLAELVERFLQAS